jgi:hypothetical protein
MMEEFFCEIYVASNQGVFYLFYAFITATVLKFDTDIPVFGLVPPQFKTPYLS